MNYLRLKNCAKKHQKILCNLKMTLEEIQKHAESDLKIDQTELDRESLRIPQLHNKYLNFHRDEKIVYQKLQKDVNLMIRLKWEYYTGKISQEELNARGWEPFHLKILKQDIEIYMNADTDLQSLNSKLEIQKIKIDYIEQILKGIMGRQWSIRAAIDWKKFISGVAP